MCARPHACASVARDWIVRLIFGVILQGTVKRWEAVAGYVRTRGVDEVLDMVKHGLKAGRFAPKQDNFAVAKKRQVCPCPCLMAVPFTPFPYPAACECRCLAYR